MKPSIRLVPLLIALGSVLYAGCGAPAPDVPTALPGAVFTQAAETIAAELTANAPTITLTPEPTVTPAPPTETSTEIPPTETPAPPSTLAEPTETAVPTEQFTYNTVIDDDFSNPIGWFTEEQPDFSFAFAEGGYRISVSLSDAVWSVRNQDFDDVRLEVDLVEQEGSGQSYAGLVCRHEDAGSYYAFVINNEGFFGIARRESGELVFLAQGTAPEGVIQPGAAANRVVAECIGDRLTLMVNGQKLADVQDGAIQTGAVGLVAGNQAERSTTEALFDNFVVRIPIP